MKEHIIQKRGSDDRKHSARLRVKTNKTLRERCSHNNYVWKTKSARQDECSRESSFNYYLTFLGAFILVCEFK